MPLIQDVPTITVYRNRQGMVNLNGEATRLMHDAHNQIDLLPPAGKTKGWQLDRRAGASCNLLSGGRSGSHLRFSAPYRAAELFRDLPADVTHVIFRLTPNEHGLDLYTLTSELPVSGRNVLQQKPRRKAA